MSVFKVWDNKGETLDRYTVVSKKEKVKRNGFIECLCLSENGLGVSEFSECITGKHLGKRIEFSSLSKDLQNHIINRYKGA